MVQCDASVHHLQLSQDQTECMRGQYLRHTSGFKYAGAVSFGAWDVQSQRSQYSQVNTLSHTDFSAAAAEERNVTTAHGSSLLSQGQPFGECNGNRVERTVIGLCDVIGGALLTLNTVSAAMTRYIAVENHDTARVICNNVNDGQNGTLTSDHTWANSVEDIAEPKV